MRTFVFAARRPAVMHAALAACVLAASPAYADKDPDTATLLSGVGTGVSSALVLSSFFTASNAQPFNLPLLYAGVGSMIITPSLGQWYAGEWFTIGMAVRVGALGLATFTVTTQQKTVQCDDDPTQKCTQMPGGAIALIAVSTIAMVGGIAYDIAEAPNAARRANRRRAWLGMPAVLPGPNGPAPGLAITGAF